MATQTATLARISQEQIFLPVRLLRYPTRRNVLATATAGASVRRETFTAFLVRALAREVARCRGEANATVSGRMRTAEVEEVELVRLLGPEALGLK